MAILFLQYSYVCTNGPIPFCIPEGILTQIFTWGITKRIGVDDTLVNKHLHISFYFVFVVENRKHLMRGKGR